MELSRRRLLEHIEQLRIGNEIGIGQEHFLFDFLTLTEPFQERELETELVRHRERFLLELGRGFAFVGRQYRLDVGDEDYTSTCCSIIFNCGPLS